MATVVTVAASLLTGIGGVTAPSAAAVTPPVGITADDLPTWQTNGIVWALAQADGVVFVGGTFSTVRPPEGGSGTARSAVNFVALDAATGAPTSCDLSFTVGSGSATVRTLAVSPDGRTLYAGGYFGAVNGTQVSSLAAIDIASCTPDTSFRPSFPATVRALAVTDDTVYAAGDFTTVAGENRRRFAAVTTGGALLPFTADADEPGRAVEVTPDGGHVLLGGDFFTVNGADSHALAVVDATSGANARTYPLGFIHRNSVVKDITTDAAGFYTGNEGTGGGVFDGRIALDLSDFDQRWRDTCLGATQALEVYRSVLYSASHAHDCSSMGEFPNGRRRHLLAQKVDDPAKLGWLPDTNDGIGEGIGPRAMTTATVGDDDYMFVGGEFTTVNGDAAQSLTRFSSGPDTGNPTTPVVSAVSIRPDEARVSWRSALDLDDSELTYKVYRDGSAAAVHTVVGGSLEWERPQLSFTDSSVTAGQSHTYRVTATDAAGNTSALSATASVTVATSVQAYPSAVLDDGANLLWRYDEASGPFATDTAGDDSGLYVNAPSYRQTPAAVTGPSTAIGLNGSDEHLHSERKVPAPTAYSMETWFRTSSFSGGKLLGFGNNTTRLSNSYDKHIYMTNTGRLVFGVNSGSIQTITTPDDYNDGDWHHVVATQGPSGMALYIDGDLAGTRSATGSQGFEGYWRAGGDNLNGWPSRPSSNFFAGQLDETAVYPSALTAAQVARHHTLATAPADTITSVTASEDSYVNAVTPDSNYGASGSLAVRGSSAYETYLRFTLPDAPAGQVLASATLQVRTNSMTSAGSTDSQSVVPVTGGWTETGVTYTGRPALSTDVLGTFTGMPEESTTYSTTLDTARLAAALGGGYDLAVTGAGTDALWLWSSEAAAASGTPRLVLTFTAP